MVKEIQKKKKKKTNYVGMVVVNIVLNVIYNACG